MAALCSAIILVAYLSLLGSSWAGLRRKVALGLAECSLWGLSAAFCLAGVAAAFLADRLILSSSMLMSFSDSCEKKRKMRRAEPETDEGSDWHQQGLPSPAYVSNEFVDLVAANVVHGHHGVECCVSDWRVSVANVNRDVLQRLGRCRLAYIHPIAFNQAAQLFQALWG